MYSIWMGRSCEDLEGSHFLGSWLGQITALFQTHTPEFAPSDNSRFPLQPATSFQGPRLKKPDIILAVKDGVPSVITEQILEDKFGSESQ